MRVLLECIGRSFVRNGIRCVGNLAGGGIVPVGDFVVDAWNDYARQSSDQSRQQDLAMLLQASTSQTKAMIVPMVEEMLQEVRLNQAELAARWSAHRAELEGYLLQIPAQARRSCRRQSDPTGGTLPAGLSLRQPADLVALMPDRLPRFKAGDRPLPHSDLRLEEQLGMGGFGEVWKAVHEDRPKAPPVALKFCTDAVAARNLRNELDLLDRVMREGKHPGIVHLLYHHLRADPPCLEYEFVAGGDLSSLMREWLPFGRPKPDWATAVLANIVAAVAHAHACNPPIVHRDLKPANILVQPTAKDKYQLKIADFGIGGIAATQAIEHSQAGTSSQTHLGGYSLLYSSPKQRRGALPDPHDDVHALGVLWYQMLLGNLAAEVTTDWHDELREQGIPETIVQAIGRCLTGKGTRVADALELATVLVNLDQRHDGASSGKPQEPSRKVKHAPAVAAGPKANAELPKSVTFDIDMKLVLIPAGEFVMGSPKSELERGVDEDQHQVMITKPFHLGKFEVTQEQYEKVMGTNPSRFKGSDLPVESVSWFDAVEFCNKWSAREGRSLCYALTGIQRKDGSITKAEVQILGGSGYRLPTEAEWEYACRAGTTTPFHYGRSLSATQANFNGKFPYGAVAEGKNREKTTKVGSFAANAFGLYDMHGNVWEWCSDWFGPYGTGSAKDPTGPASGSLRVFRGGGWFLYAWNCRSARRSRIEPGDRGNFLGLRVARIPSGTEK